MLAAEADKVRAVGLLVAFAVAGLGVVERADAAERIALVVGNGAYRHTEALGAPPRDARAIGAALERLGFEADVRQDLDYHELQQAIRDFGVAAGAAEAAVLFFSGHGIAVAEENFVLPVDARLERERDLFYEALPLGIVLSEVAQAERLGLVILDASRPNPLTDGLREAMIPERADLVGTGLAPVSVPPRDTVVALASRPGTTSVPGDGHSPYVEAWLGHLEQPGLGLRELLRRVETTTRSLTDGRQVPATFTALGPEPFHFAPPRPNRRPEIAELAPLIVPGAREAVPLDIPPPRDPDGDTMIAQVTGVPWNGSVAVDGRRLLIGDALTIDELARVTYRPEPGFAGGAGSFDFLVKDEHSGLALGSLSIEVERANRAPSVTIRTVRTPPIPLDIERPVDPDGDRLTIEVTAVPETGRVVSGDAALAVGDTLTPDELPGLVLEPGAEGARGTFAFRIRDAQGASVTATIEIGVAAPRIVATTSEEASTAPAAAAPPDWDSTEAGASNDAGSATGGGRLYRTRRPSNIRDGPTTEAARVTTVAAGTTLTVLEPAAAGTWYRVETGEGVKGYIFGELVEPVAPPRSRGEARADSVDTRADAGEAVLDALRDCAWCPALVPLPGGSFVLGTSDGPASEGPAQTVLLEPFVIGRHEVSVGAYRACVEAGVCTAPEGLNGLAPDLPAHGVSWGDARDYAAWLRRTTGLPYRLPSEAEWAYAARAGTTTRYWWGDDPGAGAANCAGCGGHAARPVPVADGPGNPFGLIHVHGNVREWVADCWFPDHTGAPPDGRARERGDCTKRVLRGGSWQDEASDVTASRRRGHAADLRHAAHGFRVARDLP